MGAGKGVVACLKVGNNAFGRTDPGNLQSILTNALTVQAGRRILGIEN
jgi:hypothetical protein